MLLQKKRRQKNSADGKLKNRFPEQEQGACFFILRVVLQEKIGDRLKLTQY